MSLISDVLVNKAPHTGLVTITNHRMRGAVIDYKETAQNLAEQLVATRLAYAAQAKATDKALMDAQSAHKQARWAEDQLEAWKRSVRGKWFSFIIPRKVMW